MPLDAGDTAAIAVTSSVSHWCGNCVICMQVLTILNLFNDFVQEWQTISLQTESATLGILAVYMKGDLIFLD